jgi:hypothetical protein
MFQSAGRQCLPKDRLFKTNKNFLKQKGAGLVISKTISS